MTLRWITIPAALCLAAAPSAAPATRAASISRPAPAGFTIPLQLATAGQGSFTGELRLLAFRVENDQLVAAGLVSGSRADDAGTISSFVRTVTLPASSGTPSPPPTDPPAPSPAPEPSAPPAAGGDEESTVPTPAPGSATCRSLRLELGPLELDLFGTALRVDRVSLEVEPVTRAAVGVLCGPAGSGDAASPRELARKLNRLVAALT